MRLENLISQLVSSVVTRLVIAGVFLLLLRFGPWGNMFEVLGQVQKTGSSANEQFEQVAEALQSGQNSGGGYDPYLDPTGVSSPSSYKTPRKSDELPGEEGFLAGLIRKLGFGDREVQAPNWVPVFPGSIEQGVIRQSSPEGEKTTIHAAVPATGLSVVKFYERTFEQMGYSFTREDNGSQTTFTAESPDGAHAVTAAISSRGSRSTLALTHQARANLAAAPAAAVR